MEDADQFFGRDEERDIIIANLKASRVTVLYGPSGVGKTSLLRAGVLAELERVAVADRDRFGASEFIPVVFSAWQGAADRRLADAIARAVTRFTDSEMTQRESLAATVQSAGETADATLLVILDQFEESFLYDANNGGSGFRQQFPKLINDRGLSINVLVSLREDALAQLDQFRKAIPQLLDTRLRVRPLTAQAAREAIKRPLTKYNENLAPAAKVSIEEGLIAKVLQEVRTGRLSFGQDDPSESAGGDDRSVDDLPDQIEPTYLQLVMARVWEKELSQDSRSLREATLVELGGAREIVRTHLDGTLRNLTRDERELAAAVFNHLVTPSGTKIAMRIPDLVDYSKSSVADVQRLVDLLEGGDERILRTVPAPPGEDGPAGVEIFHDVLAPSIRAWCVRQSEARLRREKREAEDRARRERRRARIFRSVAAAAIALLVIAIGAFLYAESQRSQANHARSIAESGQLAAQAQADFQSGAVGRGSLLSIEAYRTAPTAHARDELMHALEASRRMVAYFSGQAGPVTDVAYSPDGQTLASASADGTVALWDIRSGQRTRTLRGPTDFVESAAFSPDGHELAAASLDGAVYVWRVADGQPLRRLTSDGKPVDSVAFNPSGTIVAGGSTDGRITLWAADGGDRLGTLRSHGVIYSVAFSPAGNLLASGSGGGRVSLWDVATGSRRRVLDGRSGAVYDVAFSPDGSTLAAGNADRSTGLWDVATGRRLRVLRGQRGGVDGVAFSPDGSRLATASKDHTVGVFGTSTGRLLELLRGHAQPVESVAFSPDGRTIASGGDDGAAIVWDAAPPPLPALDAGRPIFSVAFSPDGRRLAAASKGIVNVWNVTTRQRVLVISRGIHTAEAVEFNEDGRTLAVANSDGSVTLWDAMSGQMRQRLRPDEHAISGVPAQPGNSGDPVYAVAFSQDGHKLAAASYRGVVTLWDARRGSFIRSLRVDGNALYALAYSPNGSTIAAAGADGRVFIWDARNGRQLWTLGAHAAPVEALAFSSDGSTLASASDDGSVVLWDPGTGRQLGDPLQGHLGAVTSLAFSPNRKTLVSGSSDGSAIAWNLATRLGQPVAGPVGSVTALAFSPSGDVLASATDQGTVALLGSLPASRTPDPIYLRLCGVARRSLTKAEWAEFLPGRTYQRVCEGYQ